MDEGQTSHYKIHDSNDITCEQQCHKLGLHTGSAAYFTEKWQHFRHSKRQWSWRNLASTFEFWFWIILNLIFWVVRNACVCTQARCYNYSLEVLVKSLLYITVKCFIRSLESADRFKLYPCNAPMHSSACIYGSLATYFTEKRQTFTHSKAAELKNPRQQIY